MEAQTDTQTYIERGRQALAQGQARDAAIAYAHAAQQEPDNPMIHLGLAEANLALRSYGVVHMACKKVQELQPEGGYASSLAQALLDTLDRRYDRAAQNVDAAIAIDPTDPYAHALRGYLLRARGQDYDGGLARARAARLSYGGRFEGAFPPIEQQPSLGYGPPPTLPVNGMQPGQDAVAAPPPGTGNAEGNAQREAVPAWSRPNPMQRQMVRTRFAISQRPRLVTNIIILLNVIVYLAMIVVSLTTNAGLGSLGDISQNVLIEFGAQVNQYVAQGHFWLIFTAMWLHFNILHIGLNMLSLFFIGTIVEMFYGKWRYLLIYLLSGLIGGIVTYFAAPPNTLAAGASGAIFGVFGALGVFFLLNRRALGPAGTGAIMNWLFWLVLNFAFDFSAPGIGIQDHIGGLAAGLVLGFILLPRMRQRPGPRRV